MAEAPGNHQKRESRPEDSLPHKHRDRMRDRRKQEQRLEQDKKENADVEGVEATPSEKQEAVQQHRVGDRMMRVEIDRSRQEPLLGHVIKSRVFSSGKACTI